MKRAVFLDRDGILVKAVFRNGVVSSPFSLDEFKILDEAKQLVELARELGYLVIVVTNQPDIARKNLSEKDLLKMHEKLRDAFNLDDILVCASDDDADPRRKPNPGMLLEAAKRYNIDLSFSFFVGDGLKDIEAGRRAGVKTVLLETEYNSTVHGTADYNCKNIGKIASLMKRGFA